MDKDWKSNLSEKDLRLWNAMERVFCNRWILWIVALLMVAYTIVTFMKYGVSDGWKPWLVGIVPLALIGLFGVVTNFVTKDLMQLKENKRCNKLGNEQ